MFSGQKLLFTIVVGSNNVCKTKISRVKRLKLDLVRIIEYFTPNMIVPSPACAPRMTLVTSVSYGTLPSLPSFWRENCNVWRRQDGAGYSWHRRAFLFTNTRLFYVIATG